VVTRPANPTGQMPELDAYLASTADPVLVDESFIEFTGEPSLLDRIHTRPNLFVLRSLTKFYAIPGLRAGALAGPPEVIARWRERREPWQLNVLAEAAVQAALADHEHARRSLDFVRTERAWLAAALGEMPGVAPQPSVANYLLLALDRPAGEIAARLERDRILVRDCSGWPGVPFPMALRVAVRTRAENLRLIAALRGALCEF
jgi:threonine-phosphate decarboxylase